MNNPINALAAENAAIPAIYQTPSLAQLARDLISKSSDLEMTRAQIDEVMFHLWKISEIFPEMSRESSDLDDVYTNLCERLIPAVDAETKAHEEHERIERSIVRSF